MYRNTVYEYMNSNAAFNTVRMDGWMGGRKDGKREGGI